MQLVRYRVNLELLHLGSIVTYSTDFSKRPLADIIRTRLLHFESIGHDKVSVI